jgi:tetratricopeptide (TPR) repeat protein
MNLDRMLVKVMAALVLGWCPVHAQGWGSARTAKAIWQNEIPAPNPAEATTIESALIRWSTSQDELDCEAMQRDLALLAAFVRSGGSSKLNPEIFNWGVAQCEVIDPYEQLLIGDVFYVNGDYEKAISHYGRALKGLEPNEQAHLTATLNTGACLISLGRYSEAIDAFLKVVDHPFPGAEDFKSIATINLAAAQVSAEFLSDAASTIRQLSTDNLSEYWRGIHYSNGLIVHQKLGDYAGSDSVWQHHLRPIPFEFWPTAIHTRILSEILHGGDFIEFAQFRERILLSPSSPLMNAAHSHHALFEQAEHDDNTFKLWELYRKYDEGQRKANRIFRNETQPQLQSELQLIQQELGQARQSSRNWKLTSALIVCALLILTLAILMIRSQRLRRHLMHLSKSEVGTLLAEPQVDEDDLVVLAQALTYGKGLQKALLIVRRLRAEFASQTESRLNLETIELYDELNEREKQVVGYIASGFNSKEIAQMLNVTTQYIYNIRSRIREKMGVPDDQDLLNYLRAAPQAPAAALGGEAGPRKASG